MARLDHLRPRPGRGRMSAIVGTICQAGATPLTQRALQSANTRVVGRQPSGQFGVMARCASRSIQTRKMNSQKSGVAVCQNQLAMALD